MKSFTLRSTFNFTLKLLSKNLIIFFLEQKKLFLFILFISHNIFAQSIAIPLKGYKKPASDLLIPGKLNTFYTPEEVLKIENHMGSSDHLNPAPNHMWIGVPTLPLNSFEIDEVIFENHDQIHLPNYYMAQVRSLKNNHKNYRLTLSRYAHSVIIRAHLLNKLGYLVPRIQYYQSLKIHFNSLKELESFIQYAQESTTTDFEYRQWIIEKNTTHLFLIIKHSLLEEYSNNEFDLYFGLTPDPNIPQERSLAQRYSHLRAYRALIVPFVIPDIPESINRFHVKSASVLAGQVMFYHQSASSFFATTRDDLRWILKRLASLNDQDWTEIVNQAYLPPSISYLIKSKLIARTNYLLKIMELDHLLLPEINLNYTSSDGLVLNGKITKEFIEGYPIRFSHGNREKPISEEDFEHILKIRGYNGLLQTAVNHLNEKIELLKTSDLISERQLEIQNRILNHIKNKPLEPLYQNIESWGGPIGGINISTSRSLMAGNYQQSKALIQLVDQLSASVYLGYFMGVDGYSYSKPMSIGQVFLTRQYNYIKPLLSIKESNKIPWSQIYVPSQLNHLINLLNKKLDQDSNQNEKKNNPTDNNESDDELSLHPLDHFLKQLREHETIIITDHLSSAAHLNAVSNFNLLFNINPKNIMNSIILSGQLQKIWIRQTIITKTNKGLQITTSYQVTDNKQINFDIQYFIKLLGLQAQNPHSRIISNSYILDTEKIKDQKNDLVLALKELLKINKSETLEHKFNHLKFKIHHHLDTKVSDLKFFLQKMRNFSESHKLKLLYPFNPNYPHLKPENEPIEIWSYRKGSLLGLDRFGFLTEIANSFLNQKFKKSKINLLDHSYIDPANFIWGQSQWQMIRIETQKSPETLLGIIQQNWSGWKLKKNEFLELLKKIKNTYKIKNKKGFELFDENEFIFAQDFYFYKITANLSILPQGMINLKNWLFQVDPTLNTKPIYKYRIERFFQYISHKLGSKYNTKEPSFVKKVAYILGDGDINKGYEKIKNNCSLEDPGYWRNEFFYPCLDQWLLEMFDFLNNFEQFEYDPELRTRWTAHFIEKLLEYFEFHQILKILDENHYLFFITFSGFREGDEDGDLEYFSNMYGFPSEETPYANGYLRELSTETGILNFVIEKSQGGF